MLETSLMNIYFLIRTKTNIHIWKLLLRNWDISLYSNLDYYSHLFMKTLCTSSSSSKSIYSPDYFCFWEHMWKPSGFPPVTYYYIILPDGNDFNSVHFPSSLFCFIFFTLIPYHLQIYYTLNSCILFIVYLSTFISEFHKEITFLFVLFLPNRVVLAYTDKQ